MSCIQQNFPSKFEPNDAFYEKLEKNTFVAFILKHPVDRNSQEIWTNLVYIKGVLRGFKVARGPKDPPPALIGLNN